MRRTDSYQDRRTGLAQSAGAPRLVCSWRSLYEDSESLVPEGAEAKRRALIVASTSTRQCQPKSVSRSPNGPRRSPCGSRDEPAGGSLLPRQ